MSEAFDFSIDRLGKPSRKSPMHFSQRSGDNIADFVDDAGRVFYNIVTEVNRPIDVAALGLLEMAGPRPDIYFDPEKVHAAVVTCGGLCPGLNDVIRALVMSLWYHYGVRKISGIRYGYRGLLPEFGLPRVPLTPDVVLNIHRDGGTMLGSSRGFGNRTVEMADVLEKEGVNMLFTIGGDGTQRAALDLALELRKRKAELCVVGIPKTIDNDLSFTERSFGYETAVSVADNVIAGAHVEASGAPNGVAVVKVMGRESGFIAAGAALANNDVNYVLVPEIPFELDGENGFLRHLEQRLEKRDHAVVVVAEGAGQELLEKAAETDASGNKKLGDIGTYLSSRIKAHFKSIGKELNLKYMDPSYLIRSVPANPSDSVYCARLGTVAVHAAMAGKTGLLVTRVNGQLVHVPIGLATSKRNTIDPDGSLWRAVMEATGQPSLMTNG